MAESTVDSGVGSRRWVALGGSCAAAGLVWLAFADLAVAIPTIADEMGADLAGLQWANNAFSLVTGALVIAAGKFADVYGRRQMLQLGVLLFVLFSAVAGLAGGVGTLIVGRGLMGIGAALILPATLALIPPQFSGKALLTAFGLWQAVAWGGQAIGPAIGGVITQGLGWQWLFWINVPLGIASYAVIRAFTPESRDEHASRSVDWIGLLTIALAVFALLYALTAGPTAGWGSPLIVGLLVLSVALGVLWVVVERRVADPLVDMRLFRLRPYDGALTANLVMNLAFAGLSYLLVLWLQNVRGYSAIEAGLLMLPSTLGIFLFIPVGGRLSGSRGGRMPVLVGLGILSIGMVVLGLLTSDSTLMLLAAGLLVVGVGLGLLSTPVSNTAVGEVPEELAGTAAGVFKMSSMVGGALGVAILSALARGFTAHGASDAVAASGMTAEDVDQLHAALVNSSSFNDAIARLPDDVAQLVTRAVSAAFSSGVANAMTATAVLCLASAALVVFLWPARGTAPAPAGEGSRSSDEGSSPTAH